MESVVLERTREKIGRMQPGAQKQFIFVDTAAQQLYLIENEIIVRSYAISTARLGIGNREGSCQTPSGIHRIVEKIGAGAPPGRIFKDRCDTGIDWQPGLTEDNLILTRILRLEGLEDGVNRGPGIDSYSRYIYIHGTNQESLIGTPFSHGCVCLRNMDIIELFDAVNEGIIVLID
jgi:lipoprotein-anchoring transpeptidase ErfK/SrfK